MYWTCQVDALAPTMEDLRGSESARCELDQQSVRAMREADQCQGRLCLSSRAGPEHGHRGAQPRKHLQFKCQDGAPCTEHRNSVQMKRRGRADPVEPSLDKESAAVTGRLQGVR